MLVIVWLVRVMITLFYSEPYGMPDVMNMYVPSALNLWAGRGFTYDAMPPYTPTAYRTPGYTLFLVAFYALWPNVPWLAIVLQILAEGVCIYCFFQIVKRLSQSLYCAKIATFLFLIWPYTIANNGRLVRECLFISLYTIGLFFFVEAAQNKNLRILLRASLLLVLSIYFREDGLHFTILLIFVWLWLCRKDFKKALKGSAVMLAVLTALLFPWVLRNQLTFGRPIIIDPVDFSVMWALGKQHRHNEILSLEDRQSINDGIAEINKLVVDGGSPDAWGSLKIRFRPIVWRYLHDHPGHFVESSVRNVIRYICSSRIDDLPQYPKNEVVKVLSSLFHTAIYFFGLWGLWRSRDYRYLILLVLYPVAIVSLTGNLIGRYEITAFPLLFFGIGLWSTQMFERYPLLSEKLGISLKTAKLT